MGIIQVNKFIYGLTGTILIIAGTATTLFTLGLLPEAIRNIILAIAGNDLNGVHLIQEFGSLMVGMGILCFWFMRNYQHSKTFHWAMVVYFAIFALIHWFDARGTRPSVTGQLVNTVPLLLYALTGVLRKD